MHQKILRITSIVVALTIILSLGVVGSNLYKNGNGSQIPRTNNQEINAPVNNGTPGSIGPQVGATYGPAVSGVVTGLAARHDVSPALRDIPVPVETPPTTIRESGPPEAEGGDNDAISRPVLPQISDPVRQAGFGPGPAQPLALTPLLNFAGVNNLDGLYPPDTTGDVGKNNYVQWVNGHFQIFNKSGVSLYGPVPGNTLWSGFGGPCQTTNDGDIQVLYDLLADRWVMAQFAVEVPYGECVAVSTTPDPTGSYYRYFFQLSTTVFYDYPKLGLWPDGYYLTDNRFGAPPSYPFLGASAIALDRTAMLAGQAAAYQEFQTNTTYGTLLPANLDGSTVPPARRTHVYCRARRHSPAPVEIPRRLDELSQFHFGRPGFPDRGSL